MSQDWRRYDLESRHIGVKHHYDLLAGLNSLPYVFGKIFEKGLAWASVVVLVIKEIYVVTVRAQGTVREARAVGGHDFNRDWGPALIARPSPLAESSRIAATFGHSVRRLRSRE
jgi:hypothetical protein